MLRSNIVRVFILSVKLIAVLHFASVGSQVCMAQIPENIVTESAESVEMIYAVDLTEDGDKDMLYASSNGKIAWYENESNGNFSAQNIVTTNADDALSVYTADLDEDGKKDIIPSGGSTIVWYKNEGSGDFSGPNTLLEGAGALYVHTKDLDGDSDKDIIANLTINNTIWLENKVDGGFSQPKYLGIQAGASVYGKDLDDDGDNDIIAAGFDDGNNRVVWCENQGLGSFSNPKVIDGSAQYTSLIYGHRIVETSDLTRDGNKDIVTFAPHGVVWYENQGNENFSDQKQLIAEGIPGSVYVADLNGDGHEDILAAYQDDFESGEISWFENQGDGNFSDEKSIDTGGDLRSIYAADLDEDGDKDVLSASYGGKIAWYENTENSLPVELSDIEAVQDENGVVLTWETASETSNAGFEVQHKPAADEKWQQIGHVESEAPNGTTTETKSYSYTVKDLPVGTHQFRLKQVDLDGSSTLTDQVTIDVQMQEALKLPAPVPNPASSSTTFSFSVKEQSKTTLKLYNTLGQQVATVYEGTPQAGEQRTAQVDVSGLTSGVYILRLRAGEKTKTHKLTVVR